MYWKKTVLLVEDDPLNQELLLIYLEQLLAGCSVVVATSGPEGWELFQKERPGLVLLDMQLPGMDGFTLAARMKQLAPSTPILGITAFAMPGDREKVLQSGCDDYLAKPFSRRQFHSAVQKLLAGALP
ncbi:MAG: response regulator [Desulfurispora sp.]|uniref:response regulator n=1 Tax=Desulfurispora sp. TaxID=3014275 RepID=UPI00404AC532